MHNMIFATLSVCVYSREIIYKFLVDLMSWFVETFIIGIFSDTINVTNLKLCIMVLLIELYLLITLSVTLTIYFKVTAVSNSFN